jgi:hypothetical protein
MTAGTTRRTIGLVAAALVLAATTAGVAHAGNASLKRTLASWSHRIGADARGIGLSASRRHPRRMMLRANHFRHDALLARRALAAQRPSTARGWRARSLALAAFRSYAVVGREWALTGAARLHHRKLLAARHAAVAKRFAAKGNRQLVAAARLLR